MTRRVSTRIWTPLRRLLPQPLVGAGTVALALVALAAAWITAPMRIGGPETVPVTLTALFLMGALVVADRFPIPVRRQTKVYIASEVGRRVLVVLLGALVAHLPGEGALHTVSLVGAAVVLGAGDIVSSPLGLAPMTGEPPLKIIVAVARQASLMEGAQYLMGLLGVLAGAKQVWALALLALPAGLVYLSFRSIVQAEGARVLAERAQQRAEQAARVRDEFLRAVSHDLRTPLTIMLLHVEVICTELDKGHA